MSIVGFDVGGGKSVIAVTKNRGVDIVLNEVSNRSTPTLVGFGDGRRYLGESAKTQFLANYRDTIPSVSLLLGRGFGDDAIQEETKFSHANYVTLEEGGYPTVGVKVTYCGEERVFSSTQLMAMYLSHLKSLTEKELKMTVNDCVIAIPPFFTDNHRQCMLDAAHVVGLKPLRLIHDITAAGLSYGFYLTDLEGTKVKTVALVDFGYSKFTVAIMEFSHNSMTVKSIACDRNLGGRDFDEILVKHFAQEFKTKYRIDLYSNPKAVQRMRMACERLKKVLSANPEGTLNVESLMNDIDVSGFMSRQTFVQLLGPIMNRMRMVLEKAMLDSGLEKEAIQEVKLIGGSTRVAVVKEQLQDFFGKEADFTLNQDESVAKGSTLMCAMMSSLIKVREYTVHDATPYSITIEWDSESTMATTDHETKMEAFKAHSTFPSTKLLSFNRKEPFSIRALYSSPNELPVGVPALIGTFQVDKVHATKEEEPLKLKVKLRLNHDGIFSIESAQAIEDEIIEELVETTTTTTPSNDSTKKSGVVEGDDVAMPSSDTTTTTGQETAVPPKEVPIVIKETRKKKVAKKTDLPIRCSSYSLNRKHIDHLFEKETEMATRDRLVAETADRRNAVEEYVYDFRNRLHEELEPYVSKEHSKAFSEFLSSTEDWIYADDTRTKHDYSKRLEELQKHGNPIVERFREHQEIPRLAEQLRTMIANFRTQANSQEEKFAHIAEEERAKVRMDCDKKEEWLQKEMQRQSTVPKHESVHLKSSKIQSELDALRSFCVPILTKPKPKPAPDAKSTDSSKSSSTPPNPSSSRTSATPDDKASCCTSEDHIHGQDPEMDID